MKTILFVAAIFAACPVLAGGTSWEFKVKSAALQDGQLLLELVPTSMDTPFPACTSLTVEARYADWWWFFHRGGRPSKDLHDAAVRYLLAAQKSGAAIRFGSMGSGFGPASAGSKCTIASRGLKLLKEDASTNAVYSFYGEGGS